MAIKIIGRDGQERKQGDTSSWSSPSKKSSSSSSSSSSSQQEQAAQQVQTQQQAQAYSSTYQQQNQRLQSQIQAVEAERPKENTVVNPNLKERTITAFKEGYNAGQGKEYSLARLQAPVTSAKEMLTYSLSEKANALSNNIDAVQNTMLKGLPKGAAKDFATGVTNIPEMVVSTVGNVPLGLESIARNPTTISDSIALGSGALLGATVKKAKTHPGEFAGEIAGAVLLSKGIGKIETSPSLNKQSLNSFVKNEQATMGLKQITIEKTITRGSSNIPEVDISTGPKFTTFKKRRSIDEIAAEKLEEIEQRKTQQKRWKEINPESNIPEVDISERTFSVTKTSIKEDVKLTPEMEEVLFRKGPSTEKYSQVETRDIFSPEMTQPTEFKISSIKGIEQEPPNQISRVSIGEDVKLTPEMEEVLFRKGPSTEKYSQVETRDIFSPEMAAPSEYIISSIKQKTLGYEIPSTKIKTFTPSNTIQVTSALIDTIPIVGQKIALFQKPASIPVTSALIDTIPIVGQKITLTQNTIPNIDSLSSTKTDNPEIPDTIIKQTPSIIPDITPDIIPDISPDIPTPKPDPFPNKIPDISPDIPTPTPDPFNSIIIIPPDKILSIGGGISDPLKGFSFDAPARKKTKHKMVKNQYGDPFSSKTIL